MELLTPLWRPIILVCALLYITRTRLALPSLISMPRISILILAIVLAIVAAQGPFGRCPNNCECRGFVPGICTRCFQPNRDISTQCTTCLDGYRMDINRRCVDYPPNRGCPSTCSQCRGIVPWVCTGCDDPNEDVGTDCRECNSDFVRNRNGVCERVNFPPPRTCPSVCECRGFVPWVCTRCNDPLTDIGTGCVNCISGYQRNSQGVCVRIEDRTCPEECRCGGFVWWNCIECKDPNANLSTSCKECNSGFTKDNTGACVENRVCPSYCICAGFVPWSCTRCPDQTKTVASRCTQCIDGYVLNPSTQECIRLSRCPENCNCSGFNPAACVTCLKVGFDPATNCTRCYSNYTYTVGSYTGYIECRPNCMRGCTCTIPGGCYACIDTLAVLETQCTTCKPGYRMKPDGFCTLASNP